MRIVVLAGLLAVLAGCGTPEAAYVPAYYPIYGNYSHHQIERQLKDIDWQLRMMELDQGNAEIERLLQHQELMDRLDYIQP